MPYAKTQGLRIYYEVEGKGLPLVLAHGVTGTHNIWRTPGFNALKDDFQLLLFDARGHGQSDKPHEASAYGLKMVDDAVAVLDDIGISKAYYLGYSMGAIVGFRIALYHADRFHCFMLGGGSPYQGAAEKKAREEIIAGVKMLQTDPEGYLRGLEQLVKRRLTPEERRLTLANDAEALIAVLTSLQGMPSLSNQELSTISVPCLVYCGDVDPRYPGAKESTSHIPQATFVTLPGLDHLQAGLIDVMLPRIKEFLAGVNRIQPTSH